MSYSRICDKCKKTASCPVSFFTERVWLCSSCAPAGKINMTEAHLSLEESSVKLKEVNDFIIKGTKDDLIEISRAIGVLLSSGRREVEYDIDGCRKVKLEIIYD